MKRSVYFENVLCSGLYDSGIISPCGTQYQEVSDSDWNSWFPYEKRVADGVPNQQNKDNLSIWRAGRGAFVDCKHIKQNVFFDVKMLASLLKTFKDKKQELWAGSPALEKREAYNDMTAKEVVAMFIKNQNEKQIVRSLKGLDNKPYLIMFAWQVMNSDNTWHFECVGINATKYLKFQASFQNGAASKSQMSGLIYRDKKASKNSDYAFSSPSARVEIKFYHTLEQMIENGIATKVCKPEDVNFISIM